MHNYDCCPAAKINKRTGLPKSYKRLYKDVYSTSDGGRVYINNVGCKEGYKDVYRVIGRRFILTTWDGKSYMPYSTNILYSEFVEFVS
ncbi:hypothetical protein Mahau_0246 [Mahella australiensis 50-1 BON]|uniref:Uncharacterized protein n=1 Tax=Mahella australiensis (strain DSM 15567 / CIP 107919 / 50-1 BON) TaxID=697281 RepID=F3ZX15_MAHA5|nr:hypothetical protein Mahau_0246 [Mahella australiensis 50-1 BON]